MLSPALRRISWLVLAVGSLATAQTKFRHPAPPFPYDSIEVSYENKADGIKLAGTLTLPRSAGPFPAVVLVPGSSNVSHDRDDTQPDGSKPFLVFADYLTQHGIAVLRSDDRGAGASTGSKLHSSISSLADDALETIDLLRQRTEIDPRRIGLLGHSFAGLTVSLAAARSPSVAFVVTLSGARAPRAGRAGPTTGAAWETALATRSLQIYSQAAMTNMSQDALKARIEDLLTRTRSSLNAKEQERFKEQYPEIAAAAQRLAARNSLPLIRSDILTPPGMGPMNTKAPFLAIYGSLDTTCSPLTNVPALIDYLSRGQNPDFMITVVPGLSHNLQSCAQEVAAGAPCPQQEVSPRVLQLVGDWILRH